MLFRSGAALTGLGAYLVGQNFFNPPDFIGDLYGRPLIFPSDLDKYSVSMAFEFKMYQRRSIFNQPFERSAGTVRLPIPGNLQDSYKATWNDSVLQESTVGAAVEALQDSRAQGKSGMKTAVDVAIAAAEGGAIEKLKSVANTVSGAIGIPQLNVPTIGQLAPGGLAVNPFLTVMFEKPNYKRHSFSWKLMPKNPDEAAEIKAIVTSFKYHMLPGINKNNAGTLLEYPHMVYISFYDQDDFLYRFKPCVIENMTVNYAPAGPSFFRGQENVPTEVDLALSLLEIEYWTRKDVVNDANSFNPPYGGAPT